MPTLCSTAVFLTSWEEIVWVRSCLIMILPVPKHSCECERGILHTGREDKGECAYKASRSVLPAPLVKGPPRFVLPNLKSGYHIRGNLGSRLGR